PPPSCAPAGARRRWSSSASSSIAASTSPPRSARTGSSIPSSATRSASPSSSVAWPPARRSSPTWPPAAGARSPPWPRPSSSPPATRKPSSPFGNSESENRAGGGEDHVRVTFIGSRISKFDRPVGRGGAAGRQPTGGSHDRRPLEAQARQEAGPPRSAHAADGELSGAAGDPGHAGLDQEGGLQLGDDAQRQAGRLHVRRRRTHHPGLVG